MPKSKQVIVIRKDLNMRKGKMCAQAAHASMKVFVDRMGFQQVGQIVPAPEGGVHSSGVVHLDGAATDWLTGSFTKIVVSVDSQDELRAIHQRALDAGIPAALVEDNGLTEFHGVKTATAVAIGPAWEDVIDPITKELPLL